MSLFGNIARALGIKESKRDEEIRLRNEALLRANAAAKAAGAPTYGDPTGARSRAIARAPLSQIRGYVNSTQPRESFLSQVNRKLAGIGGFARGTVREFNPSRQYADIIHGTQDNLNKVPIVGGITKPFAEIAEQGLRPTAAIGELLKGNREAAARQVEMAPFKTSQDPNKGVLADAVESFRKPVAAGIQAGSMVAPVSKVGTVGKAGLKELAAYGAAANTLYEGGRQLEEGKLNPTNLAIAPVVGAGGGVLAKPVAKAGMGALRSLSPRLAGKEFDRTIGDEATQLAINRLATGAPNKPAPKGVKVIQRGDVEAPKASTVRTAPAPEPTARVSIQLPKKAPLTPGQKPTTAEQRLASIQQKARPESVDSPTVVDVGTGVRLSPTGAPGAYRQQVAKSGERLSSLFAKGFASTNPVIRRMTGFLRGVTSKNLTRSGEQVRQAKAVAGEQHFGEDLAADVQKRFNEMVGDSAESAARVHAVLDPEISRLKVKYNDLTPQEKQATDFAREVNDYINEVNYAHGLIDDAQYEANKGGKYLHRAYSQHDEAEDSLEFNQFVDSRIKGEIYKHRKDLTEEMIDDAIADPGYLTAKALHKTQANIALKQYFDWVGTQSNLVSDVARPNFIKMPESKNYGAVAGKYLRRDEYEALNGFQFANSLAANAYKFIAAYEKLGIRRFMKETKTVFNPATRIVNRFGNKAFAWMAGVNPIRLTAKAGQAKQIMKEKGEVFQALQRAGVYGGGGLDVDIAPTFGKISPSGQKKNILQRGREKAGQSYGKQDNVYKTELYLVRRDDGYTHEQAVAEVMKFSQDYSQVALLWDVAAKLPVFGNAFARFGGNFLQIFKAGATEHPLRIAGAFVALKALTDLGSTMSGESPEDRKARENRVGARKIPFLGISTEIKTPWGINIDISRFMAVYSSVLPGGQEGARQDFLKFFPLTIPGKIEKPGGETVPDLRGLANDPLLGGLVGTLLTDTDFRGKSIKDPDKYPGEQSVLAPEKQTANQVDYLARSYGIPVGNDLHDLVNAINKKPNRYGKVEKPETVAARLVGVRASEFGEKDAEKQRAMEQYFDGYKEARQSLIIRPDNPEAKALAEQFGIDAKDAADRITRHRQAAFETYLTKSVNKEDPWYSVEFPTILLGEDETREALTKLYQKQKSHNPFWDLPAERQREVLRVRSQHPHWSGLAAPADEAQQDILNKNPWYKDFLKKQTTYFEGLPADVKSKMEQDTSPYRAEPSPTVEQKLNQLNAIPDSKKRSEFINANPDLQQYFLEKNQASQRQRQDMGLVRDITPQQEGLLSEYSRLKSLGQEKGFTKAHPELGSLFGTMGGIGDQAEILQANAEGRKDNIEGGGSGGGKRRGRRGGGGRVRVKRSRAGRVKARKTSARSKVTTRAKTTAVSAGGGRIRFARTEAQR